MQMLRNIARLKRFLADLPLLRPFRLAVLSSKARRSGHHDWTKLAGEIAAELAKSRDSRSPPAKILLATSVGLHFGATQMDGLLAAALRLRGAEVTELLCDGFLPSCMATDPSWEHDLDRFGRRGISRDLCRVCFRAAADSLQSLNIEVARFSAFMEEAKRRELDELARSVPAKDLAGYRLRGVGIGEHALSGALRFFARGSLDLDNVPAAEKVLRTYFRAALYAESAFGEMLHRHQFNAVVLHHGIYVPQGILVDVARREGVRVVTWDTAYREKCFIFSHDDTYHHTMMSESQDCWEDLRLSSDQIQDIKDYLADRQTGVRDWISFQRAPVFDSQRLDREFGLDPDKPKIGLLTNVTWDARLHYPENVFASMEEWLIETIRYFATRPDLQLVIRVHPAEITAEYPTREPVQRVITEAFPSVPGNVVIVPPESRASTYALINKCNAAIIFGTKAGLELVASGIPVIAAGEAWIRNKGLSHDPTNKDAYFRLLQSLPFEGEARAVDRTRALTYAYHFFFRRMIPVQCIEPASGFPPFRIGALTSADLKPGQDPGLDVICDGILSAKPFIYPAETRGRMA